MIWRHILLQLKLYEEDYLMSYTSAVFFPVTHGGENACKYGIDWYVYYTVYCISVATTYSGRKKTEERELVYFEICI
jgi:hypothetical protein